MADGSELIRRERARQIAAEGWTPEHDDGHDEGALVLAAVCYACPYVAEVHDEYDRPPDGWPWAREWWKPTGDRVRDLTKAGALIAAEIDRLLRKEK